VGVGVTPTSLVAWDGEHAVGLVMGYRRFTRPDTLIVRQIAVRTPYRRRGIGRAMLVRLRNQLVGVDVWWMEARVPASSPESRRLFQSFAIATQARYAESDLTVQCSVPTEDESQILVRVGGDPSTTRHTSQLGAGASASRCDLLGVVLVT
jgi:L-2,4-diaminobutyric acid acetyltransferase